FARGAAAAEVSAQAWLGAMVETEAALARATGSPGAAEAIAAARVDAGAIARDGADHAQPVVALVRSLREAVGTDLADDVHRGATSQDIVDTAAMLVARRALAPILDDARAAA